jgi:hypothetical protein
VWAVGSSSSTDRVPGFELEDRLGADLWVALQPELGRRVALRRLPAGTACDAERWPDRHGVVALFAVVKTADCTWVATRFVPGARTLTELAGASRRRRRRWLAEVATTLDGVVHGALTSDDILIDAQGRALVTGFGRAGPDATAADDRAAVVRLGESGLAFGRRGLMVTAACLAAAAAASAIALGLGGDEPALPPVAAGATAIGSALRGEARTVACDGVPPHVNAPPCTLTQLDLPGREVAAPAGRIRAWVVRGVRGRVALQILRERDGQWVATGKTRFVTIDDPDTTRVTRVDRRVPAGARFALEVAPGGAVGMRQGHGGSRLGRFVGPLRYTQRRVDARGGDGDELLLRVDVVPRG